MTTEAEVTVYSRIFVGHHVVFMSNVHISSELAVVVLGKQSDDAKTAEKETNVCD